MNPPTNRGRRFPAEPLTRDEVHKLLSAASARASSGIRLQALIAVMYGAGLRVGEALALMPRDVDLDAGTVRVRSGKGNKTRLVGLDPYAAGLLARWLDRRAQLGLGTKHPVFCGYAAGSRGIKLDPRYVRFALAKLGARAGVTKRVHPHGLRHSLAFDLAMSGMPTHQIQRQLGHSSLAITDRYVNHLAPADVVSMMQQRDWSAEPV